MKSINGPLQDLWLTRAGGDRPVGTPQFGRLYPRLPPTKCLPAAPPTNPIGMVSAMSSHSPSRHAKADRLFFSNLRMHRQVFFEILCALGGLYSCCGGHPHEAGPSKAFRMHRQASCKVHELRPPRVASVLKNFRNEVYQRASAGFMADQGWWG